MCQIHEPMMIGRSPYRQEQFLLATGQLTEAVWSEHKELKLLALT